MKFWIKLPLIYLTILLILYALCGLIFISPMFYVFCVLTYIINMPINILVALFIKSFNLRAYFDLLPYSELALDICLVTLQFMFFGYVIDIIKRRISVVPRS